MNNATPRNAARIVNSRALSLLEQLIASANGAPLPRPAAACPELASAGEACAGDGDTASAYHAPEERHWVLNPVSGEDFEVTRSYYRRCRY